MPLDEYRRKRDAARTPEPVPETDPETDGPGTRFVIQEHHARRLHWDVRLERDGVLVSWAVPKGVPADADTVRLAVRTEDHPLEYLDFHGEIPAGEYGAGRMTIWDTGTYDTEKWHGREVAVTFHGQRARGRFVFLRTGRAENDWLLRRWGPAPDDVEPLPREMRLAVAEPGERPDGWWVQPTFGGTRVLVRVDGGRAEYTDADGGEVRGPAGLGPALSARPVLLDAELVGADLWIGDLLHLDGVDRTGLPWRERHALLDELGVTGPHWRPAPVFPEGGDEVVAAVRAQGLPGVLAKDPDAPYGPGWVRIGDAAPGPVRPGREPQVGRAKLTNPRKVLYPLTGTSKSDVLAHYRAVAGVLLPHLRDRPVTMVRWPDGVERGSFFEKDVSRHAPSWIRTARVDTPGGRSETADFPVLADTEGLAWAANLAALELHVPQWRLGPDDEKLLPDLVVFDLDPGEGTTVIDCARIALRLAERVADDGLTAYPRTSGGKGMQLYLPATVTAAERTSAYAKQLAEELAGDDPKRVTAVMARARRRGRVFVDWSQNNPHKTTIGSYSLRGRARPTVATPLTWDEVRAARRPEELVFTLDHLPARLAEHGDLLAPLLEPGPTL